MKKKFLKIHLWLSIPVGLFVSLICFTGAIMVFETEITQCIDRPKYFVDKIVGERLSLDKVIETVSGTLPDSVSISNVQIFSDPNRTYRVGLDGPGWVSIYMNPYTGDIIDTHNHNADRFFGQVRQLHRWLLFQGESRAIGKRIVGVSTFIMLIIIITGLVVWFPKNKTHLKNRLKIRLQSGWRAFLHDFHVAGGFYATLLLLVMVLTGLTWSFDWYRNGVYGMFGVEAPKGGHGKGGKGDGKQDRKQAVVDYSVWSRAIEQVQNKGSYRSISITAEALTVTSNKVFGNSRASDRLMYDGVTGDITSTTSYAEQPKQNKVRGWIYSIHTGSWGGWGIKAIYLIVALIGGSLPLTGYYLYFKKKMAK